MRNITESNGFIKRAISIITVCLILLSMAGCGKYTSKYKAVGFVHSNESSAAFMSFYSFDGKMVFKLKSTGEGDLKYSAKLESGTAVVYYDYYGTKTELFSVNSGDEMESHGGYFEAGTVYVIVETSTECKNGDFHFSIA